METLKSNWTGNGENVNFLMQITKVDAEHRTVSGFASVNNVDKSDDVVTADASEEAFMTFRGNIREMHDSKMAVGRMLSFNQAPFYDEQTGQTYMGVYVTVYVSKGAQDTWEKVLDGTLSGFSIGAHILEQHSEYVPDLARTIRFITKLALFELSLVDNPANQFANVLSISKVDGELVVKGLAVDVETQNVFWCDADRAALASSEDTATCVQCSADMSNIGWIEVTDSKSAPEELKKFVDGWVTEKVITAQQIKEQTSETVDQNSEFANEEKEGDNSNIIVDKSEGGVNVSKEETVVEKAADVSEVEETETVEKVAITDVTNNVEQENTAADVAEDASEPVEKAVEASEETVEKAEVEEEDTVAKAIATLTEIASAQASSIEALTLALTEVQKSVEGIATIAEGVTKANEAVEKVSGKVEGLERATATKKSGDDDSSEPVMKAFSWDGHFASANSITN